MDNKTEKLLPAMVANSVKKVAESSITERTQLANEEAKLKRQQEKVDAIKESLKATDQLIATKTGTQYGFKDLFNIVKVPTGEKDGKTIYKNAVQWKYDTYLPTADPTTANTEAVEEAAEVSNNNQNFQE
jgi:hypothetical protein